MATKKEQKKKTRERQKHTDKVHRQMKAVKERQRQKELDKEVALHAPRPEPIQNPKRTKEEILLQLERNFQLLKEIEENYIKEQQAKSNLNAELEAEGYTSLDEKVKALKEKALKIAQEGCPSKADGEEADGGILIQKV